MIGMGIVFVLLLGEIDLSVGYVSGVGGVIAALAARARTATSGPPGVAIAGGARPPACGDRPVPGLLIAKVGVPSFVVTLAGLLAWNGVVLQIDRRRGHDRDPGRLRQRPREQLHDATRSRGSSAMGVCCGSTLAVQVVTVCAGAGKAGLPNTPDALIIFCAPAWSPWRPARRDRRGQHGPRPPVGRRLIIARAARVLDVRHHPHALRPPRLRGRRQRRGRAARGHQRRPASASPCSRSLARWRRSAASCSPRA